MAFEHAETGARVSKAEFEERRKSLRVELINAQFELRERAFSMLVLVAGDDPQSAEEVIDLLHEWLDARDLASETFLERTEEERVHPLFWRYWNALPAKGQIGVWLGGWAFDALRARLDDELGKRAFERRIEDVRDLERTLADDGTLIVKLWLHASEKDIRRRLRKSSKRKRGWRAAEEYARVNERHDELSSMGERFVDATDEEHAPWTVIASGDDEHRDLEVARVIRDALTERLAREDPCAPASLAAQDPPGELTLAAADLSLRLPRDEYSERLERLQDHLSDLSIEARERGIASVLVFEGWDAAGKGGAIRRMTHAMAARDYEVVRIGAPSAEEHSYHYLWRFWRQLPRAGRMTIFDRSWYGRILVERVEGLAAKHEWRRAGREIREFERLLVKGGVFLRKFWLHIDREEQLRRFAEREETPYKKYKITPDDYRNRAKWDAYAGAVDAMFAETHRKRAPWVIVAANDKRHARVRVLEEVCAGLERAIAR